MISRILGVLLCTSATVTAQCLRDWAVSTPGAAFGGQDAWLLAGAAFQGDLVLGGRFTSAGGKPIKFVARRSGPEWHSLGEGVNNEVYALLPYSGLLIAGGYMSMAGGVPAGRIAAWDGVKWQPLGGGLTDGAVFALCEWESALVAGGSFTAAGGAPAARIARWNGFAWSSLGSGMEVAPLNNPAVYSLATYKGQLVAGGLFWYAGGTLVGNVARWDGAAWHAFSGGLWGIDYSPVLAVHEYQGHLYAGGLFSTPHHHLARWDGSSWDAFGGGEAGVWEIRSLRTYEQRLIAAGSMEAVGGVPAKAIASWDGHEWSSMGEGLSAAVHTTVEIGGDLVAAGSFDGVSGLWAVWECPECYPDCNGDATLNLADFGCFTTRFALAAQYADCNGDGVRNLSDFGCFTTKFALGCP